jgi:hypothetical protein
MKQKLFLLFLLTFSFLFDLSAQTVYVKVKSGSAYLGEEYLNADKGTRSMTGSNKLKVSKGAVVIARQDSKLVQLTSNKTYSKNQIITLLASQKETVASGYTSVLFSDQMQKSSTIKSGSVSRGNNPSPINWEDLNLSPMDGCIVINDTIHFELHNDGVQLLDTVQIINLATSEVYVEDLTFTNAVSTEAFGSGSYSWKLPIGFINQNESSESYIYESHFNIPSDEIKDQIINELESFKRAISIYDLLIQQDLIEAICQKNGWCF